MSEGTDTKFSIVIGGPFWRLQERLGLLGPDQLPRRSAALLCVAIAWLPLALLSMAQGFAWSESPSARFFLFDVGSHARYAISIAIFIIMESITEVRVAWLIRQFSASGLVAREDYSRFMTALQLADRRSSSALAEAIIAGMAFMVSAIVLWTRIDIAQQSWRGAIFAGHLDISLAGWWELLVSLPLFWFLGLRWLWRFVVWTRLLWEFAGLKLRMVATHPDRSGGLGFLNLYPLTFAPLIFSLSCVAASAALEAVWFKGISLTSLGPPFAVWVALMLIIFVGPLAVFVPLLARVREEALLDYEVFAIEHNRSFEEKWRRRGNGGRDALGSPDISSLSDIRTVFESVEAMGVIPVSKSVLAPLLVAIGLPWVFVVAAKVPLGEILKILAGALF